MTLANNYVPVVFTGNGVTTDFSANWNPISSSYIEVIKQTISTGAQVTLTVGVNYVVTAASASGFTISFSGLDGAPSSLYKIILARNTAQEQDDPYSTTRGYQGTVLENSFDQITAIAQELQEQIDRALISPIGSSTIGVQLPAKSAGKALLWDPTGATNNLVNSTDNFNDIVTNATAAQVAAQGYASSASTSASSASGFSTSAQSSATAAAASAASINLPGSLTGKTLNMLRVKSDESGYEFRTPTQVRTDISALGATSGSAIQKANGTGGLTAAVAGTDYIPATAGSAIQKASAGGLADATRGTDYSLLSIGTPVTASSTSVDFTIPSGVKEVTFSSHGLSTNGTSIPIIQIGNSTPETSGYLGASSGLGAGTATSNFTTGFGLASDSTAASLRGGSLTLTLIDATNNIWAAQGVNGRSDGARTDVTGGSKALSGALTKLRLTTVNGTDTFDAGTVNVKYEF